MTVVATVAAASVVGLPEADFVVLVETAVADLADLVDPVVDFGVADPEGPAADFGVDPAAIAVPGVVLIRAVFCRAWMPTVTASWTRRSNKVRLSS